MYLNTVRDKAGSKKKRLRVGRGPGSGKGKTCGRGQKGQKSRSGMSVNGFEGGQMPIYRRLPKRGFNPLNPSTFSIVNIGRLQKFINEGSVDPSKEIDFKVLTSAGLIRRRSDGVRLLGNGTLDTKISIKVDYASSSAVAAIEKAGGEVKVKSINAPLNKKKNDTPESSKGKE